ncbi:MAG: hypothetical protein C3F06_12115 [Candidatus Methanoperedenaceae archaeon]|nr:MAG: hypothetical protein C3F06_12115 [Candidatus Methanoperedenaceae archaeon]
MFKKITVDNWREPDEISSLFINVPLDEWISIILEPNLREAVPIEIKKLFEVARGALVYGYFFYPLYTLGLEQLFRVAEAAVTRKCKTMEAPPAICKGDFQKKVKYLVELKVIPNQKEDIWNAIRGLRNIASHPQDQSILAPGEAIGKLSRIADEINSLFSNSSSY